MAYAQKKSLPATADRKGRYLSRFHPLCFILRPLPATKPLHSDDNGVTGPDWGRSELVFGMDSFFAPLHSLLRGHESSASYEDAHSFPHPSLAYSTAYSSLHRFIQYLFYLMERAVTAVST